LAGIDSLASESRCRFKNKVTGLLNRLGIVGVSLVAGALIFGVITGGIVIHRLENPAALVTTGGHHDQRISKSPAKSDKQDQQGSQDEKQDSESGTKGQSGSATEKNSD
jgi:hypothetical protein